MSKIAIYQLTLYFLAILICVKPLGIYMAKVFEGQPCGLNKILGPLEHFTYRLLRINPNLGMTWSSYLRAMLMFNLLGILLSYALLRLQAFLPLNPQSFPALSPDLAFNVSTSFATTTDWQSYTGETTLSYFSQMVALTTQNFTGAATGMSLLMALIRGLRERETSKLGNFWVDTTRGIIYILLPLSLIFSVVLVSEGVIQNFKSYQEVQLIQPFPGEKNIQTKQTLPMGPVASQEAIKQLGANGGGFFNVNSAHPFENPTPFTNFLEMLAILLIPTALCYTFGVMVGDKRQGWAIIGAMFLILLPLTCVVISSEQQGIPQLSQMGIDETPQTQGYSGGNMEGKETRHGIVNSALWASAATATSNGSVNSTHDSYTPLGGLILLGFMQMGEVIFGGVGSGLSGMLILVIMTVFVAGLMVGRTPEYIGKKIEPYEMKMASLAILMMPFISLVCTAIAVSTSLGTQPRGNPGAHGFSEILYAFVSMTNNNGSAFAGLNANTPFYNTLGGIAMLIGRYWIAIPILAIAGSLGKKKHVPQTAGTLLTYTPLFIILLMVVILIIGALTFFPALALGPIVEHIMMWSSHG